MTNRFRFRRRRRAPGAGTIAAVSAGGLAAGAALFYALDRQRSRERLGRAGAALREAGSRLRTGARSLGGRAAGALRTAEQRASTSARGLGERARGVAAEVKAAAASGREELAGRSVTPGQARTAAGGVLLARALLGGGLLRIPFGVAGVALLSRAAAGPERLRSGVRRAREAARSATDRLRAARGGGEEAPGGARRAGEGASGRRSPEVIEVKSPSELERGIASASPEPTYEDRVDRGGYRDRGAGKGPGGRRAAGLEDDPAVQLGEDGGLLAPGTDDVERAEDFDAPEPGASVREEELGAVLPREGLPAEPDEVAGTPPRVAGAPEGDAAERKVAGAADTGRREPTGDGE